MSEPTLYRVADNLTPDERKQLQWLLGTQSLVPVEPPDNIDDPHPQLVWLYWDEEHAESRWKPLREVTDE